MKNLHSSPNLNDKNDKQRRAPRPNLDKLREEKRKFLKEFSSKYGYNGKIDQIREEEYPQLKNEVYLDHTGATTFAKSAVVNFTDEILSNLYGNPHSQSPSSMASSKRVEEVRNRILRHFGTNENDYSVVFTANATAAIKLVGEMFPWSEKSTYRYLRESHNSVNGLRRFLEAINPDNTINVTENDVKSIIRSARNNNANHDYQHEYRRDNKTIYSLFAYPAQCNFSGMRFPLGWAHKIKKTDTKHSRTLVLLDAAAFVPSSPLSLANKDTSPDFVCLSFYKMFGFPTGLGALIVKKELNPILRKGYFGGGSIDSVAFDQNWARFSENISTRYEDGTINFLNIIALDHAFNAFEKIYGNIKNISNHVTSLNTFLSRSMASFRHWNGQPVCKINSDRDFSDSKAQGGILSFNVKGSDGNYIGYFGIDKLASSQRIHIRSGGNCNPGSSFRWNGLYSDDIIDDFEEGKVCSDDKDIYKGKLWGAARVSIGAMTTIEDVLIWLDFFKKHYVEIMPGKTAYDLSAKSSKTNMIDNVSKHNLNDADADLPSNNSKHNILSNNSKRDSIYNILSNNSNRDSLYNVLPNNSSKLDIYNIPSNNSKYNLHNRSIYNIPSNNSKLDSIYNIPSNNSKLDIPSHNRSIYNIQSNHSKRDFSSQSNEENEHISSRHDSRHDSRHGSRHGSRRAGRRVSRHINAEYAPSKQNIDKYAISKHGSQQQQQQRHSFALNLRNFLFSN
jgi:selenocysteine lyase/cysteine desulfurase